MRYFADEKSAKAFAAEKTIELLNEGRRNGEISGEERRAVLVAREKGFSLKDAVEHYASHLGALNQSVTVEVAIDELLSIRQAEGKSSGHVHDLLYRLKRFAHASQAESKKALTFVCVTMPLPADQKPYNSRS